MVLEWVWKGRRVRQRRKNMYSGEPLKTKWRRKFFKNAWLLVASMTNFISRNHHISLRTAILRYEDEFIWTICLEIVYFFEGRSLFAS